MDYSDLVITIEAQQKAIKGLNDILGTHQESMRLLHSLIVQIGQRLTELEKKKKGFFSGWFE